MSEISRRIKVVPPELQIAMVIISFSVISFALWRVSIKFTSTEATPKILHITPKKIREFGGFPDQATVGLYIDEYQTFDIVKNEFLFTGIVWFVLNQGVVSLDSLGQFEFERATILYKSPPDTRVLDNRLLVQYRVRVQFTSPLDYSFFPLDDHRIFLMLTNPTLSPHEILFESSIREFQVKPNIKMLGWNLKDTRVEYGYLQSMLDAHDSRKTNFYPSVLFTLDYIRFGIRHIIATLLPILLIFYLASFAFCISPTMAITLTVGCITAVIAYRFVIENISPVTGYLMLSDYLFFLLLGACFFVFFVITIDQFAVKIALLAKKIILISLHLFVALFIAYIYLYSR